MSRIDSLAGTSFPAAAGSKPNDLKDLDINHFLQLMISELTNQDPLNPMDNTQLVQQIGSIREIAATDQLTGTLNSIQTGQSLTTASSLIGKRVAALTTDNQNITGVVDRLVQKGLLVRNPSSRDRRACELQITEAGKRTLRGITPAVEAAQRSMLRGLTEKEGADLMRLLRKAIAAGNELSRAPLRDAELR